MRHIKKADLLCLSPSLLKLSSPPPQLNSVKLAMPMWRLPFSKYSVSNAMCMGVALARFFDRRSALLLLFASCKFGSDNVKFHTQSESLMIKIGLFRFPFVLQLFYFSPHYLRHFSFSIDDADVYQFATWFDKTFQYGAVMHGPIIFIWFGMTIDHFDEHSNTILWRSTARCDWILFTISCSQLSAGLYTLQN